MSRTSGRVVHHRHDMMYVDEEHRRCVVCNEIKLLKHFDMIECDEGYKVIHECNLCVEKSRAATAIAKRASSAEAVAKAMSKAIRRPMATQEGPSLTDYATNIFKEFGGSDVVAKEVARVAKESFTNNRSDPKTAATYARLITDMLSVLHRNKDEPLDLSQLSEDDLFTVLMEPAKTLILTDKSFVDHLLADTDVRSLLLKELGVLVVEADGSDGADGPPEEESPIGEFEEDS